MGKTISYGKYWWNEYYLKDDSGKSQGKRMTEPRGAELINCILGDTDLCSTQHGSLPINELRYTAYNKSRVLSISPRINIQGSLYKHDFDKTAPGDTSIIYDDDISKQDFNDIVNKSTVIYFAGSCGLTGVLDNVQDTDAILVLAIDTLRHMGFRISKGLSYEKTVEDFLLQLKTTGLLEDMLKIKNYVVLLGLDGAIVSDGGSLKLIFDPLRAEGDYAEGRLIDNINELFLSSMSKALEYENLTQAVIFGLDYTRSCYDKGFLSTCELRKILDEMLSNKAASDRFSISNVPNLNLFKLCSSKQDYSILDLACSNYKNGYLGFAKNIVINGCRELFRTAPACKFGNLETADRFEIENFRAVKALFDEYMMSTVQKPVSIAVFGTPGSGKSFGVKEIAKNMPYSFEIVTLNMSQFTSLDELLQGFQAIRDISIKGRMPLVFFDEFDSDFNGNKRGWLKYFLAPMQDGEFMENGQTRIIGRGIFVFAGATATSFENFLPKTNEETENFKMIKGPDFVSRLKGILNIQGPNPVSKADKVYIIRRAMLLRSLLKRSAPQLFDGDTLNIDDNLLEALLSVNQYRHGARSMEFLIAMSSMANAGKFSPYMLPTREQLNIHVDADYFYGLLNKNEMLYAVSEKLAQLAHQMYVEKRIREGSAPTPESMKPWDELEETYKNENRAQILYTIKRFENFNIGIRPKFDDSASTFKFDIEVLENLAELEHERWIESRKKDGWKYGPVRNNEMKLHPCMVSYSCLDEATKDYDRDPIRNIPMYLDKAGYELYSLN